MSPIELRSTNQIMADLLQLALDGEWSGRANTSCHCHPEYVACCPECEETEYDHSQSTFDVKQNKHKTDCKRMALIEETRAFLRVENTLAEERGEETVYFP